ncbi:MAG: hypothetical protein V3W34_14370, partial [Phycisphaerae bacterium]
MMIPWARNGWAQCPDCLATTEQSKRRILLTNWWTTTASFTFRLCGANERRRIICGAVFAAFDHHGNVTGIVLFGSGLVDALFGMPRDDPRMRVSSGLISRNRPDWDSHPNTYYWYYATLA